MSEADPALITAQRELLLNQVTEHRAKIAALTRQQAQKEAEQATTTATIHKLEMLIPVIQARVDIRKTLMDKELGSKLTYFETLQLLVEQQEELRVQKSHLHETEAAEAAIRETRRQAEAEYRHTLSDDLAKAEQKASGLSQDLIKAEQKTPRVQDGGRRDLCAAVLARAATNSRNCGSSPSRRPGRRENGTWVRTRLTASAA